MFQATRLARRKRRAELVAQCFFGFMAMAMVVPLLLLLAYLVVKAWPSLSWEFLTTNPRGGGVRGGIWSAFVGTIYLVVGAGTLWAGLAGANGGLVFGAVLLALIVFEVVRYAQPRDLIRHGLD